MVFLNMHCESKQPKKQTMLTIMLCVIKCLIMCRFLAEIGSLHLLDDEDKCISLEDIYKKVAEGIGGPYLYKK